MGADEEEEHKDTKPKASEDNERLPGSKFTLTATTINGVTSQKEFEEAVKVGAAPCALRDPCLPPSPRNSEMMRRPQARCAIVTLADPAPRSETGSEEDLAQWRVLRQRHAPRRLVLRDQLRPAIGRQIVREAADVRTFTASPLELRA